MDVVAHLIAYNYQSNYNNIFVNCIEVRLSVTVRSSQPSVSSRGNAAEWRLEVHQPPIAKVFMSYAGRFVFHHIWLSRQ